MTQVSPSLLSADFGHLHRDMQMLNESAASMIHLDVMDGVFVPNISFGFPVIKCVRQLTDKPLDVHLMITDPGRYVRQVADCGADIMNVHLEACTHLHRVVQQIKDTGMKAAVTLNPSTPVSLLTDILSDLDMVLIMSVNPGFAAQKFIEHSLQKVKELRALITATDSKTLIEIDGGINLTTGRAAADAGADILVAGNYVFSAPSPIEAIAGLAAL